MTLVAKWEGCSQGIPDVHDIVSKETKSKGQKTRTDKKWKRIKGATTPLYVICCSDARSGV
jgi:hypothetical protein